MNYQQYSQLSRDQLISKLIKLEGPRPKKLGQNQFDFTKTLFRKVALKISYQGQHYHGFTSTAQDTVPTIESHLFRALSTCKLIADRNCAYSLCGRTDKGVSAFGQVISLYVRTNSKTKSEHCLDWDAVRDLKNQRIEFIRHEITSGDEFKSCRFDNNTITDFDPCTDTSVYTELNYCGMINRLLPSDIRVIGWTPVPHTFDARFSCTYRKYKYYFRGDILNIPLMKQACKLFIGEHDFRNFCKIDPSKAHVETFFARSIMECEAVQISDQFYCFVVKGRAFLWHQIRNMFAVLEMIGRGLEEPSIVTELLDVKTHDSKPNFEMADDFPLVLVECGYNHLEFMMSAEYLDVIDEGWRTTNLKALQMSSLRDELILNDIYFTQRCPPHAPLLKRKRCMSVSEVAMKKKAKDGHI